MSDDELNDWADDLDLNEVPEFNWPVLSKQRHDPSTVLVLLGIMPASAWYHMGQAGLAEYDHMPELAEVHRARAGYPNLGPDPGPWRA